MSAHVGSARMKRHSVPTTPTFAAAAGKLHPPPPPVAVLTPKAAASTHKPTGTSTPTPRRAKGRASVTTAGTAMARNRETRAPPPPASDDTLLVLLRVAGARLRCLTIKDYPCESLVATAMAEYRAQFPACEIPHGHAIQHLTRQRPLPPHEPIGQWCRDGDELEILPSPTTPSPAPSRAEPTGTDTNTRGPALADGDDTVAFSILFHRLPLGFTMRQEFDTTVVANIYPRSAATHYPRLVPGVTVVSIAGHQLARLGLRQVHEIIKHATLPLAIGFRAWRDSAHATTPADRSAAPPQRRKSVPARPPPEMVGDEEEKENSEAAPPSATTTRSRAHTTSAVASTGIPVLFSDSPDVPPAEASTRSTPSPCSQRLGSERKKSNASSPYADTRGRRSRASSRTDLSAPETNQGHSPEGDRQLVQNVAEALSKLEVKSPEKLATDGLASTATARKQMLSMEAIMERFTSTRVGEAPRSADAESNQTEEESEEAIAEHMKVLQAELTKKYEEAKLLADQLERYQRRLQSVRAKRTKKSPPKSAPSKVHSAPAKLRLTPEALEEIDSSAGVPPKSNGHYASSNASSISGYSGYSNRSAVARRRAQAQNAQAESHAQLAKVVGRTGADSSSRCDASVSSCNSATSQRRRAGSFSEPLRSPRKRGPQSINNRYNYMPPKYSATTQYYDAPSSFSTKGGLISRAKLTRDSFIKIPESPGVGAYDIKLQERVRGGEIGDSDRSLPWP